MKRESPDDALCIFCGAQHPAHNLVQIVDGQKTEGRVCNKCLEKDLGPYDPAKIYRASDIYENEDAPLPEDLQNDVEMAKKHSRRDKD